MSGAKSPSPDAHEGGEGAWSEQDVERIVEVANRLSRFTQATPNEMKVILLLGARGGGAMLSRDVGEATGIRQSHVSTTIKHLRERGWVACSTRKQEGQGRPWQVVSLVVDFDHLLGSLVKEAREQLSEVEGELAWVANEAKKAPASPHNLDKERDHVQQ